MTMREAQLEARLRRWCVVARAPGFHCDECGGKWTRYANTQGKERHVATCVLFRPEQHDEAPAPPAIPF